jgi:hypothetical protein
VDSPGGETTQYSGHVAAFSLCQTLLQVPR